MMLTKPGIILGNIITTASGFALASQGHVDWSLFIITLVGLGFIIAAAGVFNNYTDRYADAKMSRTKNRPLATGKIPSSKALLFGAILFIIGAAILGLYCNGLTLFIALFGFFVYLVLYAFWKYRSFYGTIIGSIAGAVPPVVGYCAVSNHLDFGAFLLFMMMVFWQMPHFFAIAIYRYDDYAAANIPVLPISRGMEVTKIQIILYIIAFTFTSLLLTFAGYTGLLYAAITLILGLAWLAIAIYGFRKQSDDRAWAREMFVYSLVVIMCLSMVIPAEKIL